MHAADLLLVDDDPTAIRVLSRILPQHRHRFATSGYEAMRLARESRPDLVLLDAEMPGMSGFDVCQAFREDALLRDVPLIFVTSHDDPAFEASALRQGACDFIAKPVQPAQVAARVRLQLQLRDLQLQRRLEAPAAADDAASQPTLPRILIVDDDITAIKMMSQSLKGIADCYFATDGSQLPSMAEKIRPSLVLLDARMPGVDGYSAYRSLKARPETSQMPVVFVTRYADLQSEMHALDLGAADFVAKPYVASVLRARVNNLLRLHRDVDDALLAVRQHGRRIAQARVADILASAPDPILCTDAQGRIVLFNAEASQLFGRSVEGTIGCDVTSLFAPADAATYRAGAEAAATAPIGDVRHPVTRLQALLANGDSAMVEARWSHIDDGPEALTTVTLHDMRDRDRLEAEQRARGAAESAARATALTLSTLAHEIGNPLNVIQGFAQLIADDTTQPPTPEQAHRIGLIQSAGRHLQALMRDVSDLGRLAGGQFSVEHKPVDLAQVVREALAAVGPQAQAAAVTVEVRLPDEPVVVVADPARWLQCLLNLLSNAIKYNRPGGWVGVTVASSRGGAQVKVEDNGLGMDAQQLSALFEPFNRLGREQSGIAGTGLGLALTRKLVEAMGAQLSVASRIGKGSRFTVRWSAASAHAP